MRIILAFTVVGKRNYGQGHIIGKIKYINMVQSEKQIPIYEIY